MNDQFFWELADAHLLVDRQWDADAVVWHSASGDTHLLDDLATRVYRRLKQAPASLPELAVALPAWALHLPTSSETRTPLEATLQEMVRLGLVLVRPH